MDNGCRDITILWMISTRRILKREDRIRKRTLVRKSIIMLKILKKLNNLGKLPILCNSKVEYFIYFQSAKGAIAEKFDREIADVLEARRG